MSELHVAFRVGDATYVLPAATVVQMESFSGATRVPGSPAHVAGLVQVRGAIMPVVDLRARFQLPPAEATVDTRIVVVERESRRVALLVDSARDILKIDPAAFEPPPEVVAAQSAGFVQSVARVGGGMVMLIDCDRVIGKEELHGQYDTEHG
jgi:purine-binding chemotaxis protein CheW